MHTKYNTLDDAICRHIETQPKRHPIYSELLARMAAQELGRGDMPFGDDKEWRLIDRRLQALKKAGRIRFVREMGLKPRWELVSGYRTADEPVAWMHSDGRVVPATTKRTGERDGGATKSSLAGYTIPLYATPQQQKPLTDEKILQLWPGFLDARVIDFARAVEAAHQIGIKETK